MKSYKKILVFFMKINGHRVTFSNSSSKSFNYFYSSSFKKFNLDLNRSLISIYSCLRLIQFFKKNKSTILMVGDSIEFIYFMPFFKIKSKNFFIIPKWINGLITNWEKLSFYTKKSFFKNSKTIKKSKKLRFFRYFFSISNFNKPDLILVSKSNQLENLFKEAKYSNIPVVFIGSHNKSCSTPNLISYKISVNITNFSMNLFIVQLFCSSIMNEKLLIC